MTTKPDPLECLVANARQLGPDELDVLTLVAERLVAGRSVYGELQLDRDVRDFRREALEELADAAVYAATGLIREQREARLSARQQIARTARRRLGAAERGER